MFDEQLKKIKNDWDVDSFDTAPKINLDDYKTDNSSIDFDDKLNEIYKIVDAVNAMRNYIIVRRFIKIYQLLKSL